MASYPAVEVAWRRSGDLDPVADLLYAALDPFQPLAIDTRLDAPASTLDLEEIWSVFFRSPAQRDAAAAALDAELGARLIRIDRIDVPDDGWGRRSQAQLRAIRVGRVVVAPPWDVDDTAEIQILIEPSTGFGTGHHETTRLCLAALQEAGLRGRRVVDVGTGSGVLAITAAKLGAAAVVAVDNDPDALRNTRENVAMNEAAAAIEVIESELSDLSIEAADVVVANLTAPVLVRHADALKQIIAPGGVLIASGFGDAEEHEVAGALAPLRPRPPQRAGAWSAVVFDSPGA